MAILECRELTKYFDSSLALDHVSLTVEPGRIVGLLGPNGSGKSTLIKLANGLLVPSSGAVTIDGHDMNAILDAIDALPAPDSDVPTVIIGKTVKGHGVSFMENNVSWHAGCVNEADWIKAKAEITEAYERKWGAEA